MLADAHKQLEHLPTRDLEVCDRPDLLFSVNPHIHLFIIECNESDNASTLEIGVPVPPDYILDSSLRRDLNIIIIRNSLQK